MSDDVRHFLTLEGEARDYRISKPQEAEYKRLRNKKLHDQLKTATKELRSAIEKRDGAVYQAGIGMNGGYFDDDPNSAEGTAPPKKKPRMTAATRKCSACRQTGHNRTNRICPFWKPRGATASSQNSSTEGGIAVVDPSHSRDMQEQELLDRMAFAPDQDVEQADAFSTLL